MIDAGPTRSIGEHRLVVEHLGRLLDRYAYRFASEAQLHEALAQVLREADVSFVHEHQIDAKTRFDFWIDGVVIEVKVGGTLSNAVRQADRYIARDDVHAVLIASTEPWALKPLKERPTIRGKPVAMVKLRRQAL